jgi:hypothetical protein
MQENSARPVKGRNYFAASPSCVRPASTLNMRKGQRELCERTGEKLQFENYDKTDAELRGR